MTRVIPALPVNSLAVSCQHLSDFPIQEFGIDSVSCHAELQPRHHCEGKGPPLRGPVKMDLQAGKGLRSLVDLQIKNVSNFFLLSFEENVSCGAQEFKFLQL